MKKSLLIFLFSFAVPLSSFGQQTDDGMKWFNPIYSTYPILKGKYWRNADSANFYTRMPTSVRQDVGEGIWNLAKQTTGVYIDFYTSAKKITVNYQCGNPYKIFDAMSKISTNGLDMHVQDVSGKWYFLNGTSSFKDTISFTCNYINPAIKIKRFRLYMPLHNYPKWLEIGVAKNADFKVEPASVQNPIVFYGTSILQGGSTSRHGLTWESILGRRFDIPLINLGFSGSGRLDRPIIDLISGIDAKLFVLDCQPNLLPYNVKDEKNIEEKIRYAVQTLHGKQSKTPILLVEHSGGMGNNTLDTSIAKAQQASSAVLHRTYLKLKPQIPNLYVLTAKEIGFTYESTVDGTHPSDFGMMQYANAYEKAITKIIGQK